MNLTLLGLNPKLLESCITWLTLGLIGSNPAFLGLNPGLSGLNPAFLGLNPAFVYLIPGLIGGESKTSRTESGTS